MTTQTTFEKSIRYDRETGDFCATLDGQLIGFFASRHAAEVELDRVAFDWLTHGNDRTASELDGAQVEAL